MSHVAYELFGNDVDAHVAYALAVGGSEAEAILRRRIDDGSWTHAAQPVVNALGVLASRDDKRPGVSPWSELTAMLVDSVTSRPLDAASHSAIESLTYHKALGDHDWGRLASWLLTIAGPGETSLVAYVVERALSAKRSTDVVAPLAAWLLDNGASELRSRRHQHFVRQLVRHVLNARDDHRLTLAIRYALANDAGARWYFADNSDVVGCNAVIEAIERAATIGADPDGILVIELARAARDDGPLLFATLINERRDQYPTVARVAIALLVRGDLDDKIAQRAWPHVLAFWSAAPDTVIPFSVLAVALDATWQCCVGGRHEGHFVLPPAGPCERAWMSLFMKSFLRHRGDVDADRAHLTLISRLASMTDGERFAEGVVLAMREHIATEPDVPPLLAALLASSIPDDKLARVVLKALPLRQEAVVRTTDPSRLLQGVAAGVERCLAALVARPRIGSLVDVRRVAYACLDGEDKTRVQGDLLEVDRAAIAQLASLEMSLEEQIVVGVQYVLHEAIHLQQGIGDKAAVTRLRQTGAESTLMQLDLAADHLAAIVAADGLGSSLLTLKELQGRSLMAYPTNSTHTIAARARKANRLVGLRLDYLARRSGLLSEAADEHVFADFGPAGGSLAILATGPPLRLVAMTTIDRKSAELLMTAADPSRHLAEVDAILASALERASVRVPGPRA